MTGQAGIPWRQVQNSFKLSVTSSTLFFASIFIFCPDTWIQCQQSLPVTHLWACFGHQQHPRVLCCPHTPALPVLAGMSPGALPLVSWLFTSPGCLSLHYGLH